MESSYFRKFTEPSLSSGIPHWISLYTRAPKFLIFSADRGLKFLKKNRNTVCKQAMHSQFTDPAPVAGAVWGGRGGLAGRRGLWSSCHWNALLYSTEQNRDSFRFPQVSFLFFPPLLFFSLFSSLLFLASLSFPFPLSWSDGVIALQRLLLSRTASCKSTSMKIKRCLVSLL